MFQTADANAKTLGWSSKCLKWIIFGSLLGVTGLAGILIGLGLSGKLGNNDSNLVSMFSLYSRMSNGDRLTIVRSVVILTFQLTPPPTIQITLVTFTTQRSREREREMFYLTTHSTHFIYGYMASDMWLRTILIVRKETRCRHIGYSFRLTASVLLYAPPHRQDSTYHGLCYTSRGALAGTGNSSMGPPHEGSIRRPIAP